MNHQVLEGYIPTILLTLFAVVFYYVVLIHTDVCHLKRRREGFGAGTDNLLILVDFLYKFKNSKYSHGTMTDNNIKALYKKVHDNLVVSHGIESELLKIIAQVQHLK